MRGYKEEGTTTTPFDMVMLNDLDRFHLVIDVIDRVPGLAERAAHLRQEMEERAPPRPRLHARARRRRSRDPRLDLAVLNVLVVNAGSTSLKLSLVDEDGSAQPVASLEEAPAEVDAVGHRVVHGGDRFREPVRSSRRVLAALDEVTRARAAPQPARARGDRGGPRRRCPTARTSPSSTPPSTRTHAGGGGDLRAPARRWRERGLRRYRLPRASPSQWAAEQVPVPRLVVCHLGGGCSVTAVRDGRSVDTTMGFTPLEGLPMATRSGSVDPGALLHLLRSGVTVDALDRELNEESGLKALGGLDDAFAFSHFTYRLAKAVAGMVAVLGGIDVLAFSGGIGENRADVRDAVAGRLRTWAPSVSRPFTPARTS